MYSVIKEILAPDGKHKVEIIHRSDGSFGFEAWKFSDEPMEQCWFPYGRYSICFAADAATAEKEARERVDFIKAIKDVG